MHKSAPNLEFCSDGVGRGDTWRGLRMSSGKMDYWCWWCFIILSLALGPITVWMTRWLMLRKLIYDTQIYVDNGCGGRDPGYGGNPERQRPSIRVLSIHNMIYHSQQEVKAKCVKPVSFGLKGDILKIVKIVFLGSVSFGEINGKRNYHSRGRIFIASKITVIWKILFEFFFLESSAS